MFIKLSSSSSSQFLQTLTFVCSLNHLKITRPLFINYLQSNLKICIPPKTRGWVEDSLNWICRIQNLISLTRCLPYKWVLESAVRAFCASCWVTYSTKAKPLRFPNFIGNFNFLICTVLSHQTWVKGKLLNTLNKQLNVHIIMADRMNIC